MTIGPYQATGSSRGLPETRRKRMPASPACTTTSSARSKRTRERLAAVGGGGGLAGVAEFAGACEDVGEGVAGSLNRERFAAAGSYGDVDVDGIGGDAVDGAALAPEAAADETHVRAVI